MFQAKRLSENATIPKRATPGAAGYDLYSAADITVHARGRALVPTDVALRIPEGCYARVAARSSLAFCHGLGVGAGVVDADYRGGVGVVLFNHTDSDFQVKKGDRVAQLILERIFTPELTEVESLDDTERGHGGFGSTGR